MDITTMDVPSLVTYILGIIIVAGGAGGIALRGKIFGSISNVIVIISSAVVLLEQIVDVFSASMTAIVQAMKHVQMLAEKAKSGLEDNKLTPEEWTGIIDEFTAATADLKTAQEEAEKIYPQIEIIITQLKDLKEKFTKS